MDAGALLAIVTGLCGLSGLVFTALHFRTDDSKAIVDQQSSVLRDMALLNDQLKEQVDALKAEVADLREQNQRLRQ